MKRKLPLLATRRASVSIEMSNQDDILTVNASHTLHLIKFYSFFPLEDYVINFHVISNQCERLQVISS